MSVIIHCNFAGLRLEDDHSQMWMTYQECLLLNNLDSVDTSNHYQVSHGLPLLDRYDGSLVFLVS